MKKIIVGLLFLCSVSNVFSQIIHAKHDFNRENWEAFKKAKVYVVLGTNMSNQYDTVLVSCIKKYWKFNEFEFINSDQFAMMQTNTTQFFLFPMLQEIKHTYSTGASINYFKTFLIISQGNAWGQLGSSGLSNPLVRVHVGSGSSFPEQLPVFVKYLEWYCDKVYSEKITNRRTMVKYVNGNCSIIKTKPLYIMDFYLNSKIKTIADIKNVYNGQAFIVSPLELSEIANSEKDASMFVSIATAGMAWVYVYSINTGELLYEKAFDTSSAYPGGLIPFFLKKWNK